MLEEESRISIGVVQEFQELQNAIIKTKSRADNFAQNWFSKLPFDIIVLFISFLPSFTELGRMACVSKEFNRIINTDERFWKVLCLDWWSRQEDCENISYYFQESQVECAHPLEWIHAQAYSFDPEFSWKWFGKCCMQYR